MGLNSKLSPVLSDAYDRVDIDPLVLVLDFEGTTGRQLDEEYVGLVEQLVARGWGLA